MWVLYHRCTLLLLQGCLEWQMWVLYHQFQILRYLAVQISGHMFVEKLEHINWMSHLLSPKWYDTDLWSLQILHCQCNTRTDVNSVSNKAVIWSYKEMGWLALVHVECIHIMVRWYVCMWMTLMCFEWCVNV